MENHGGMNDDVDRGKLLICPPDLFGNLPAQSSGSKQEERGEKTENLAM
jgi:hypothetical protein